LLFSCNGRGSNLFTSSDHDVLAIRQGLSTSGIGGFFGAGEIGPVGGRNHLHGFSASMLVFGALRHQPLLIPDVPCDRTPESTG
jgi:small ligand-binding sensory domain FIST